MALIMMCLILAGHIAAGQAKILTQRHPLLPSGRYYGNATLPASQSNAIAPISSLIDVESVYESFSGNSRTFESKPTSTQIEPTSVSLSEYPYTLFSTPSSSGKATAYASISEPRHTSVLMSTSTENVITYSLSEYPHTVPFTSVHGDGGVEQTVTVYSTFLSLSIASSPLAVQSQVYSRVSSSDTDAIQPATTRTSGPYVPLKTSEERLLTSLTLPSTTTMESSALSHVTEMQHSSFKASGFTSKSSQTLVALLTASQYKQLQDAVVVTKQATSSSTSAVNSDSSDTKFKPTSDTMLSQSTSLSTVKSGHNRTEASTDIDQSSQALTLTDSGGPHSAIGPSDADLPVTSSALPTGPGRGGDMFGGSQQEQSPKAKATMAGIAVGAVGACAFVGSSVFIFFRSYKKKRLRMVSQSRRTSLEIKCIGNAGRYESVYAHRYR